MTRLIERVEQATIRKSREVALTFVEIVTSRAPVDTSKLISNFQVSVGNQISNEIEAINAGVQGSTAGSSRAAVIQKAKMALQEKQAVGQVINVTNNVPYLLQQDADKGGFLRPSFEAAIVVAESTGLRL